MVSIATTQQKWLKRALKPYFWKVRWMNTSESFLMTFEVGQGVSGINPQGFHGSVWEERGYFSYFFTFQTLKCSISQNTWAKSCGFIRGIYVLLLNVPDKFHYLSPKHINVMSSSLVPNFCSFPENRLFLDSN